MGTSGFWDGLFWWRSFGVGYIGDELVTDQERAQIRQQAAQLAHVKRLKNAQKLESEQKRAEHEKIFAPPPPRPGDMVTRGRGAVIGTANSLTFTALLDPATGRVVQILYREEQKASQEIRALTNLKSNDPLQGRVMEYVRRVQSLAACCERDAKPGCDQKFSPESQRALQVFRKETEAAIGDLDGGGAIFHPFAGSAAQQANPALARPAARPALHKPTTR
jgi:hypothetical protein